jgi:hypothetical protein
MRRMLMTGLSLGTMIGLAGCGDPEYSHLAPGGGVNTAAAVQIVGRETEPFSAGRLASMIEAATPKSPQAEAAAAAAAAAGTAPPATTGPESVARLDQALASFAQAPYGRLDHRALTRAQLQMELRDARNQIQDQLIAASTNRCNVYKVHLRRLSSAVQFGLGSGATMAGAAGALVTGGASQALAAAAGALSGVNAEFQKDYLGSLVTAIIIPGIDRQRADLRNDIVAKSCLSISDYPLSLAISEVIRFHGACSADVGIAASGQAVARTTPDSISAAIAAIEQVKRLNTITRLPTKNDVDVVRARAKVFEDLAKKAKGDADKITTTDADSLRKKQDLMDQAASFQKRMDALIVQAKNMEAEIKAGTVSSGPGLGDYDDNRPTNLLGSNLTLRPCNLLDSNGKEILATAR